MSAIDLDDRGWPAQLGRGRLGGLPGQGWEENEGTLGRLVTGGRDGGRREGGCWADCGSSDGS